MKPGSGLSRDETSGSEGRLSTLDLALAAVDSPRQPADFGVVLHLSKAPTLEDLRAGARSARNLYRASGSVVRGNRWVTMDVPADGVAFSDTAEAIEKFIGQRMDPRRHAPIQQLLVTGEPPGRTTLVTRVHHAVADGFSAAMWLHHQFRVAYGLLEPLTQPARFESIRLRQHPAPVRKSPSRFRGPSQSLRTADNVTTGFRRWMTITLPDAASSDVLATAALETLVVWNRMQGAVSRRVGLWFPVNIRQRGAPGFGNGTSRVRIYPHYSGEASFAEKCCEVRRQIRWSLRNGEWAVPSDPLIMRLGLRLSLPLMRLYLSRPWADMGTSAFTHATEWSGHADCVFQDVQWIECIGQLHRRHAVVMNSVKHRDKIWLTFTYDPGRMLPCDIEQFADLYRQQMALAMRVEG